MNDQANSEPNPPQSKSRKWVLGLSLGLNILVVAALVGAVLRPDGGPVRRSDRGPVEEAGIGPFGAALSKSQRRALAEDIRERRSAEPSERAAMRENLAAILDLIRAEDFDPDALREIFAATQLRLAKQQSLGVEALIGQISAMDATERTEFANRLENGLRKIRRPRK